MPATKVRTSIWSAQTLTAGASDTVSSGVNLSAGYGAQVDIRLTNGASGPTVAAQVQVQVACDAAGTLWVDYGGPLQGGVANDGVYSWSVEIPIGVEAVRLVAGSNTVQDVTIGADISNVTGL